MNDIARYEHRKRDLLRELEFVTRTRYRVLQFTNHGDVDITESRNQQLQVEIDECDLMIAHETLHAD